ncbi:HDOD domain-containing protein [Comamonas composti]|uniref:HDOD domain-containing protein n=1 Tax=Comamonas composti TaxID=408558 RepID=UPI0003FBF368|nr:HDOD domain-containing protein [Comamonas composti]
MVQSVLSNLTLGYQPLWNRSRRLAGLQLYLHEDPGIQADWTHFLRLLQETWSHHSPPLLLSPQSRQILCSLLEHAPKGSPWIAVRGEWLQDSGIYALAQQAHARGLMLVWSGLLTNVPLPPATLWFSSSLLELPPEGADGEANLSQQKQRQAAQDALFPGKTPVQPIMADPSAPRLLEGQMYTGLESLALAHLCLDRYRAGAIAGWPVADALSAERSLPAPPSREIVLALIQAIDAEQSLEMFEQILDQDPVLAYRFLLYTNSAALGLRGSVDSLRRGLVMLGYGTLRRWLTDLLPHSSTAPDLRPVRTTMQLRAMLADRLIQAGVSHELQREVYLCGLFSQLDLLLGTPLAMALRRLPLSERILDAILAHSGPYAPPLLMAMALESNDPAPIRQLREEHGLEGEEVNRLLLRMLSEQQVKASHEASA